MTKAAFFFGLLPLLGCQEQKHSDPRTASKPQTVDMGLGLAAGIVSSPAEAPSLLLTLHNLEARTIAVQTGGSLNDKLYPAASFHFLLQSEDGTRVVLDCGACAPASIIGGSLGPPYKVFLNPSEGESIRVPLSSLFYFRGATEHTVSVASDKGKQLTVSLQGVYSEPASWTGKATVSVEIP